MRADEKASAYEIDKARRRDELLKKGSKSLAGLAVGGAGLALSSKIVPFLSDLIPVDLAVKGISKINPKLGDFLKRGMAQGLNAKDGLNFLREQLSPKKEKKESEMAQSAPEMDQPIPESEKKRQEALGKFNQKIKQPSMMQQEQQRFQQGYGQQTQQQAPQGQAMQDLMAAIQAAQQSRQRRQK